MILFLNMKYGKILLEICGWGSDNSFSVNSAIKIRESVFDARNLILQFHATIAEMCIMDIFALKLKECSLMWNVRSGLNVLAVGGNN